MRKCSKISLTKSITLFDEVLSEVLQPWQPLISQAIITESIKDGSLDEAVHIEPIDDGNARRKRLTTMLCIHSRSSSPAPDYQFAPSRLCPHGQQHPQSLDAHDSLMNPCQSEARATKQTHCCIFLGSVK
jgi:hypothetical protein